MSKHKNLKKFFTNSEMQELINQLNALRVNGEQVFHAEEGNWKFNGMYVTIENDETVGHMFLPLTKFEGVIEEGGNV